MLNHVVMFRRKAEAAKDPAQECVWIDRMAALGAQLPGIRAWRLSVDEVRRPISWDLLLEASVDDLPALGAFLQHPLHLALVADIQHYFEWAVIDHTLPAAVA